MKQLLEYRKVFDTNIYIVKSVKSQCDFQAFTSQGFISGYVSVGYIHAEIATTA